MSSAQPPAAFAPLSEAFPAPDVTAWVELARKTLKGADPQSLERRTADGLAIRPLYTALDAPSAAPARIVDWEIRARIEAGPGANTEALEALEAGASSLLVEAHDGGAGLAASLAGVMTDVAPVALDAGFAGVEAARALDEVAKASPAAPLAFHLDPLGAYARDGGSPGPIADHLGRAAQLAEELLETYPRASFLLASGLAAHEAGASPAQEIAFAAASAVAYLRALETAGARRAGAAPLVVFALAADAEPLTTIPKLRAGRRVFQRILQAVGAGAGVKIEARASRRMLTRADPWTNLIRLTVAGFGAAVGGADAIVLQPFDEAAAERPSPLARRQARNIQLVIAEESGLHGRPDPASGSYALETLTDDLAALAWTKFQAIEAAGGLATALRSGLIAAEVAKAREALRAQIASGERRIVGVTDFRAADEPAESRALRTVRGGDDACPPLEPIRLEDLA